MASSPSANPECQTSLVHDDLVSYSKAYVLNSVVKKTVHTWKKAAEEVGPEVPLFSLIFYTFKTIKPEKFLTLAYQY